MRWLGLVWDIAAWAFIASAFAAPVLALVQRCRARSRRLFRDEPTARVRALHHSPIDHSQDGLQ